MISSLTATPTKPGVTRESNLQLFVLFLDYFGQFEGWQQLSRFSRKEVLSKFGHKANNLLSTIIRLTSSVLFLFAGIQEN
jgi:hypothetical protein